MRQVGLRRVTLNSVEMRRIFLDPVNLNLGEQVLVNNRFASMTIGSELVTNGDFSSATGWDLGSGWSIDTGLGTLTHDGTAKSNTTQTGFTAFQSIKTEIITDSNDQTSNKALVRETFLQNKWTLSNDSGPITDVNWECSAGTAPTIFSIRDTEENLSSRVFSLISIKPVTLDSWSEIGTRTATEHLCYDGDQALVNIFSGGAQIGITQAIPDFVAGDYYYSIGIANDNAGSLKLSTPTDGDLATIDNTGPHTGVISLTDANIQLEANGACDVTPSYFDLYPIVS